MKDALKKPAKRKLPTSWIELAKASPAIFKKYGGGELYLKKERSAWYK